MNEDGYGEYSRTRVIQIDPTGCGCTECITGQYVPLDQASSGQIDDMLEGRVGNATQFEKRQFLTVRDGEGKVIRIIDPAKNDDFLDAVREFRIR